MKKLYFIITYLCLSTIIFASNEVTLKSKLTDITVFTNGAEILRTAKSSVNSGISNFVITNLENRIDFNSLQVMAKGDVTILSINNRRNYLKEKQKPERILSLEAELKNLEDKLLMNGAEKEVIVAEIDLILSNMNLGSANNGVKVSDLKAMADYYNKRLLKLKLNMNKKGKEISETEKKIAELKQQINELLVEVKKSVNEVVVTLSAKKKSKVQFNLGYIIYDAGWESAYDIRVDDINSDISISYKANVWQKSGFDWEGINIKLSTRDPRKDNSKPELYPWYLNFIQPRQNIFSQKRVQKSKVDTDVLAAEVSLDEAETMAGYMNVTEKQLAVEFKPTIKVTIPSDGKYHNIALDEKKIDARYEYYTAPKLNDEAYLVGYIKDFKSSSIVPGQASIYFEGAYVGKTYLNPESFETEFPISLGVDKNIFIKRKQISDFTESKFLSGNIERKFAYEIDLLNNKNSDVDIIIEENIPLSQHEDIEVELIEKDGAKFNDKTGLLKWTLKVNAGSKLNKKYIYTVSYPKDKKISNL